MVGGGIAGITAAVSARRSYPDARVELVCDQGGPFYNRIGLGAVVAGEARP